MKKFTTGVLIFVAVVMLGWIAFLIVQAISSEPDATVDEIVQEIEDSDDTPLLEDTFVTVHLEVRQASTMDAGWGDLENLVALADEYEVPLTIGFTPGWASYALEEGKLSEVRAWESSGHELAMHHHGISHASWDGYSNTPATSGRNDFLGDMEDLMVILNQLPASGQILTTGMTDEDVDFPEGILYNTTNRGDGAENPTASGSTFGSQGGPSPEDMISSPIAATYNGVDVIELGKMGFAIDHLSYDLTLEEIQERVYGAEEGQVLGLVLNDNTMEEHLDEAEDLFILLSAMGLDVQTVKDILVDVEL